MPDDSLGRLFLDLVIVGVFIIANGFFSATEMAVITLNDNKIRKMAEEGHNSAKKVLGLLEKPGQFLAVIQVGVTLAGFLSSAIAADKFAGRLVSAIDPQKNISFLPAASTIVITVILAYFSLVLGELVPKQIAQRYPERIAFFAAGIIKGFGIFIKPFVGLLTLSTNVILKLLKIDPEAQNRKVTEEEIRMMVDVGRESGGIEDEEKEMIENIFEFNDKEVSEIMTHRTKIISLAVTSSFEEVIDLAEHERFTRIPVFKDSIDNIVGILHTKDLLGSLRIVNAKEKFSLAELLRPVTVVPETKNLSSLFREMQIKHRQMAVVLDEYGGTAGIVTVEDLLEEIVGNITDEFDEEDLQILRLVDGDLLVSGDTSLDDIEDALEIDLPDEDYDTIAGFVIHLLDRIPDPDENPQVEYENVVATVESIKDKWISKIRIHVLTEEELQSRTKEEEAKEISSNGDKPSSNHKNNPMN